jgi:hypothetical protein
VGSKITAAEMRAHVMDLLAPLDNPDDALIVHWNKRSGLRGEAALEVNEIWLPLVKSRLSYAVALHEVGHMLGRHRWSHYMLTRERDAWRWAKAHALVWTKSMEAERVRCLLHYEYLRRSGQFNQFGRMVRSKGRACPMSKVSYWEWRQDRRGRWSAVPA